MLYVFNHNEKYMGNNRTIQISIVFNRFCEIWNTTSLGVKYWRFVYDFI